MTTEMTMTTDPTIPPDRPVRDVRAELAAAIATAGDPQAAAAAVWALLGEFGRARPAPALADFLVATAAHLREHGLCDVGVGYHGRLQLSTAPGREGWELAAWAHSLGAPIQLTPWTSDPGAAEATITSAFPSPTGPIPVKVWDVLRSGAELLGQHRAVRVSADQLRAWMATHTDPLPVVDQAGGGERS